MALIGTTYLAYIPTQSLREAAAPADRIDDYGMIYTVKSNSHSPNWTAPSREDLDAAHWVMFMRIIAKVDPVLAEFCERHGFNACWSVHRLDMEAGEDAVEDARSLGS
jgi:hypothetical protein